MARIRQSNPRFRTKDEIVADIAFILTAPVAYGTKYAVLFQATWVWTEMAGKYEGCPYWTDAAFGWYCATRKAKSRRRFLRHEHAVPRKVVIQMLTDLESPSVESVRRICESFLIGVVVTKLEDDILNLQYKSAMPQGFYDQTGPEFEDPWLRYKQAGIKYRAIDLTTEDYGNLDALFPLPESVEPAALHAMPAAKQQNDAHPSVRLGR